MSSSIDTTTSSEEFYLLGPSSTLPDTPPSGVGATGGVASTLVVGPRDATAAPEATKDLEKMLELIRSDQAANFEAPSLPNADIKNAQFLDFVFVLSAALFLALQSGAEVQIKSSRETREATNQQAQITLEQTKLTMDQRKKAYEKYVELMDEMNSGLNKFLKGFEIAMWVVLAISVVVMAASTGPGSALIAASLARCGFQFGVSAGASAAAGAGAGGLTAGTGAGATAGTTAGAGVGVSAGTATAEQVAMQTVRTAIQQAVRAVAASADDAAAAALRAGADDMAAAALRAGADDAATTGASSTGSAAGSAAGSATTGTQATTTTGSQLTSGATKAAEAAASKADAASQAAVTAGSEAAKEEAKKSTVLLMTKLFSSVTALATSIPFAIRAVTKMEESELQYALADQQMAAAEAESLLSLAGSIDQFFQKATSQSTTTAQEFIGQGSEVIKMFADVLQKYREISTGLGQVTI